MEDEDENDGDNGRVKSWDEDDDIVLGTSNLADDASPAPTGKKRGRGGRGGGGGGGSCRN